VKPLIGLTSYREQAKWGVWNQPADLLPVMYADAIVRAGGVPVVLPPATDDPDAAAAVVARLDGLVVSGGADVEPATYGEEAHEKTVIWRPDRDAWELALLTSAAAQNLPTLGVCRGMQVMAVAAGGTLDQHTPDLVGHEEHSPGADAFGDIAVSVDEDSLLHTILGPAVTVRCHHHQSVRSHPGYEASASAADGTLEAIEAEGTRFCLGVQWHPEAGRDQRLFDALVKAAVDHAQP
jgi:putative glutamine amidotransferase